MALMSRNAIVPVGLLSMALAGLMPVASTAAQATNALATHRAVYDIKLKEASERSGISGMYGRMVYEFDGSPCDGYTVNFRFVTQIESGDQSQVTDQQTTTYEDIREQTFRFVTRTFVDRQLQSEVKGAAHDDGETLSLELEAPEARRLDLPDSLFPTRHMIDLLERAGNGERFYEARVFDGSDDGDEAMITTTIIGARSLEEASTAVTSALSGRSYWPVSISYFHENSTGDAIPVYTIAFKLYDNGVSKDLTMDYGEFSLEGHLTGLEMFDAVSCEGR